jgi:hypothetical protein
MRGTPLFAPTIHLPAERLLLCLRNKHVTATEPCVMYCLPLCCVVFELPVCLPAVAPSLLQLLLSAHESAWPSRPLHRTRHGVVNTLLVM